MDFNLFVKLQSSLWVKKVGKSGVSCKNFTSESRCVIDKGNENKRNLTALPMKI